MPQLSFRFILAGAGLMAGALVAPLAGQKPAAARPLPRAAAAAARPAPGSLHAGIQVHGRWTIVVRNKDGSVAARREFENSLQLDGVDALPLLLDGNASPGSWAVYFGNASGAQGPCGTVTYQQYGESSGPTVAVAGPCFIVSGTGGYFENATGTGCAGIGDYTCAPNLQAGLVATGTVDVSAPSALGGSVALEIETAGIELKGFAPVTDAAPLDTVGTTLTLCTTALSSPGFSAGYGFPPTTVTDAATASPAACRQGTQVGDLDDVQSLGIWNITGTQIPGGPINVIAGQTVQVTVVISFS